MFDRHGFRLVAPEDVAAAKWLGYDQKRKRHVKVYRWELVLPIDPPALVIFLDISPSLSTDKPGGVEPLKIRITMASHDEFLRVFPLQILQK